MFSSGRRKKPGLILILLSSVALLSIITLSLIKPTPGVEISLEFYDKGTLIKSWLGIPGLPKGRVYVEVYAIAPPGYSEPEVKIFNGTLRSPRIFISYSGKFKGIVDKYYEWLSKAPIANSVRETSKYGLRIDLWIISENNTIQSYTYYVTYSPWKIHRGERITKTLRINMQIPISTYKPRITSKNNQTIENVQAEASITPTTTQYCFWITQWTITPEDLASNGVSSIQYNGQTFVETPLVIVYNYGAYSGILRTSLELSTEYNTGVAVGIGVGYKISAKVGSGSYDVANLGVTLYKSGYSIEKEIAFGYSIDTLPNAENYIYIYTRPYVVFEKEKCYYYGDPVGYYTDNERLRLYISEIAVNGVYAIGGMKNGNPPYVLYDLLFNDNASIEQIIRIDQTPTSDGDLDPGESILFKHVFNYYDVCGVDFEASVPIGLIAGSICTAASLGTCAPFALLLSATSISLELNPGITSVTVGGLFLNCGDGSYCGSPPIGGFNVYEELYMRISKLKYRVYTWYGYCEFQVPVAFYVKSW